MVQTGDFEDDVFLDMSTFGEFNDAYVAAFGDHRQRSTIGVAALPQMSSRNRGWAYFPER